MPVKHTRQKESGMFSNQKNDFCKTLISVITNLGIYTDTLYITKQDTSCWYLVLILVHIMIKMHYMYDKTAFT
jgi:hypothetical protein